MIELSRFILPLASVPVVGAGLWLAGVPYPASAILAFLPIGSAYLISMLSTVRADADNQCRLQRQVARMAEEAEMVRRISPRPQNSR